MSKINANLFLGSDIADIKGKLMSFLPPFQSLDFNIFCLQCLFAKYHTFFPFLTFQYKCYFNIYFSCLSLRAEAISCTCFLCNLSSNEAEDRPTFFVFFFFIFYFLYCSGFSHTLKWNSHEFTCVPHPDPPSHLPLHPIPLGLPSAPDPSACLMHPTWAGDLFHPR